MPIRTKYTSTVFESRSVLSQSLQYTANLVTGKCNPVPPNVQLVQIPKTAKSTIDFVSADISEGIFNLFFVRLDNNNSFLFLLGNIKSIPIIVGGNFLRGSDTLHLKTGILPKYLKSKIKSWQVLYKLDEDVQIIQSANTLIQDVYKLI